MGDRVLVREDSASSRQSRESTYYAELESSSSVNTERTKNIFKQYETGVAGIISDIGQLQICRLGDESFEDLLARNDIPEEATLLQDFREGIKCGDIKSPISSRKFYLSYYFWFTTNIGIAALSRSITHKSTPELPSRPRKLQRRPRKDSVRSAIHGGIISSPLEASMDVHPGEIAAAITVADAVLKYSPYESLRSYNLSQPTVEEEGMLSSILSLWKEWHLLI